MSNVYLSVCLQFCAVTTVIHITLVVFIIIAGLTQASASNYSPFAPFGARGVFNGASIVFFSYIGFDAIVNTAEEVMRRAPAVLHWCRACTDFVAPFCFQRAHQVPPCIALASGLLKYQNDLVRVVVDRLTSPLPVAAAPRVQCKNPSRDLPIGLLGSLSIVTILYILAVLTICLMLPYTLIPSTSAFSSVR